MIALVKLITNDTEHVHLYLANRWRKQKIKALIEIFPFKWNEDTAINVIIIIKSIHNTAMSFKCSVTFRWRLSMLFPTPRTFLNVGLLERKGLILYFIYLPEHVHCHSQKRTHWRWTHFSKTVSQILSSCSKYFSLFMFVFPIKKKIKNCCDFTTKATYWPCLVAI